VPASSTFNWLANESFSIEFWLKTAADQNPANNQVVVGRGQEGVTLRWWIGVESGTGKATFYLRDESGITTTVIDLGPRISNGQWHHVVLVRDAFANKVRFYVNAVATFDGTVTPGGFGSLTPVTIGYLGLDIPYRFDGLIDEVAIYNRTLSGLEIGDHFAAGQAGKSVTSLRPPPVAVAGADQNVTVGAEVTLSAAGSTGTDLTYLWTQTAPTAPVVVNNATTPTVTFTAPDVVGDPVNFTFRLTVTDEYGHSAADDVTVTVSAASAPPPAPPASGGGGGGGCFINSMF
jgi:hypothetical protein